MQKRAQTRAKIFDFYSLFSLFIFLKQKEIVGRWPKAINLWASKDCEYDCLTKK